MFEQDSPENGRRKNRKKWTWIIGGIAAVILGVIGALLIWTPWQTKADQQQIEKEAGTGRVISKAGEDSKSTSAGATESKKAEESKAPAAPPAADPTKSASVSTPEPSKAKPAEPPKTPVSKEAAPKPHPQPKATATTPVVEKPEVWRNWNTAPYATSQEEACRKAPEAIDGFSMPQAVRDHFKLVISTSCGSGRIGWLTPSTELEEMWSGPDRRHKAPHLMKQPKVAEIAVMQARYRPGTVAQTAKADVWTYVHEGKTYVLYLPHVCFNWSWGFGTPPVLAKKPCYTISFNAPPGVVRWGVGVKETPLPPDECNALQQGDKPWTAWYGDCVDAVTIGGMQVPCVPPLDFIRRAIGSTAFVPHRFVYVPVAERQTLRFSAAVLQAVVYICLEDKQGRRTCGVYMRPQDWNGRTHVDIPDSLWRWGDENCPN